MRFDEIIVEDEDVRQSILDIITSMAGEDASSLPLDAVQDELRMSGIDISDDALFDVLDTMDSVVTNIEDGVVFFNPDGPAHDPGMGGEANMDAEMQKGTVKSMAQKQVQKGLDK